MAARIGLVLAVIAAVAASALAQAVLRVAGDERIVSGWEAEEGQFPFQLSLRMVNGQGYVSACGATIIHHEWGLTAAHCTAGRVSFVIRVGTLNLTRPAMMIETQQYHNHPAYDESIPGVVQPNDIGLIKFNRFVEYSDLIQPIRLQRSADMNRNYDGLQLIASGWGNTWTGGSSPENLNWVYLLGNANFYCWITYGGSSIVQDSTICASFYNVSSQSTCQGDSGGSLAIVEEDGVITQVGVTSFVSGTGCHTSYPAGFIRPGHYHNWFTEVTGINFDWEPSEESEESEKSEESSESSESSESESGEGSGSDESDDSSDSSEEAESEEGSGSDRPDADGSEVWIDSA